MRKIREWYSTLAFVSVLTCAPLTSFCQVNCWEFTPPVSDDGDLCYNCVGTYLGVTVTNRYGAIPNIITTDLEEATELIGGALVTTDCNTKTILHEETQYVHPASHVAEKIYTHQSTDETEYGFGLDIGVEGVASLNFSHHFLQSNKWEYKIRESVQPGATSASVPLYVPPGNVGIVMWKSRSKKWNFKRQKIEVWFDVWGLMPSPSPPIFVKDCWYHVIASGHFSGERHYGYTCSGSHPQYQFCGY